MTTPTFLSTVQTDAFCDCGYNLHGRPVWRDERLGILICQCPECGRHASAGRFTGIHATWLHRVSSLAVVSWVLFLLLSFVFLTVVMWVMPVAHISDYVARQPIPGDTAGYTPYVYMVQSHAESWRLYDNFTYLLILHTVCAAVAAFMAGLLVSSCLWHLRGRGYLFLLLPLVAGLAAMFPWIDLPMGPGTFSWIGGWIGYYVAIELGFLLLALGIGRTVSRFVLSLLLPPVLLQHFAFLWIRDGKSLPVIAINK